MKTDKVWAIDHSAGRPILVLNGCSVIEAEDAEYVLALIRAATTTAEPVGEPTRSQKMRDAGFTPRTSGLACDECGAQFAGLLQAQLHECASPAAPKIG